VHAASSVTPIPPSLLTSQRFLALVDAGVLTPDDRVELLEGVISSAAPHGPMHAAGVHRASRVLRDAIGTRALVRSQLSLHAGPRSVPEPDIAVVPGSEEDYERAHPSRALLVVEIAETSLATDRLTKAGVYAAAHVPEYWIVNLRGARIEIHRRPRRGRYTTASTARRGRRVRLVAFPDVAIAVDDLLPTSCR
jgi:Uma2 family endonuclease